MAYETVIVGLVPESIAEKVRFVRATVQRRHPQLRLHTSNIPPHVTIVEPVPHFFTAGDAARIAALPLRDGRVTLGGYAQFANRPGSVIYQKCTCPGIMQARNDILGLFPNLAALVSATPTFHLTIIRPVPAVLAVPLLDFVESTASMTSQSFTIPAVAVYQRRTPTSPWELPKP